MISVIIPIYNCEQYIEQCIDSVLEQSYRELEVLLIDDGSTDRSGDICDWYKEIDSRVRVIHKINEGLVAARKTGVNESLGELLFFVDSDDWIEADTLERMIKQLYKYDADIVIDNAVYEWKEKSQIKKMKLPSGTYSKDDFMHDFIYADNFFSFGAIPNIWGKLYKKSIYREIQMSVDERIKMGEDVAVTIPYISKVKKNIVWNADVYSYHYRQLENSMVKNKNNNNRFEECEILFNHLDRTINNCEKYKDRLNYYYLSMLIGQIKNDSYEYTDLFSLKKRIKFVLESEFYKKIRISNAVSTDTFELKYRIFYFFIKNNCSFILAFIFRCLRKN